MPRVRVRAVREGCPDWAIQLLRMGSELDSASGGMSGVARELDPLPRSARVSHLHWPGDRGSGQGESPELVARGEGPPQCRRCGESQAPCVRSESLVRELTDWES